MTRTGQTRGYTLVEMMMSMFILSVVLVLGTALVERLLTLDDAARGHVEALATASMLGHRFRADVRAADAVDDGEAPGRLVLTGPADRSVTYAVEGKRLSRVVRDGKAVRQAEEFRLPSTRIDLRAERLGERTRLTLWYDRRASVRWGEPSPIRFEAMLGVDHRFDPKEARP